MIPPKWLIASIFLILTFHLAFVESIFDCTVNDTFSSNNSLYKANLVSLFPSLSTNVDINGFYNTSVGQSMDTVFGSVLCRADVQPNECVNCIQSASSEIVTSCPNGKQAIIWNEICTLRYSNESMFGILAKSPTWYIYSVANSTSPELFKADLRKLLDNLVSTAAYGGSIRKVAVANTSTVDFQTIFSLLQCTPDLSAEDCSNCLVMAISDIPDSCDGKIRCRVLKPSCILRYGTTPFYNETRLQELHTRVSSSPPPLSTPAPPLVLSQPPPPPLVLSQPPPPPTTATFPALSGKKENNKSRTTIIATVLAAAFLLVVCVTGTLCMMKRKKKPKEKGYQSTREIKTSESLHEMGSSESLIEMNTAESLQYDFEEVKAATNGFSDANKLGKGGFGAVYWGKLPNGQEIAVKRLSFDSGQGDAEFKNEVLLVARLQHKNLVKLLGFSIQGREKLLIYEFVENASLDRFIFDRSKRPQLGWERRYNIIMGIAKGLLYLHEDSRLMIIHRDMKSSNILLDREMNPKIADFGMARLFVPHETLANTTKIVGTHGYMAPEYAMLGQFSVKSDVFSFGVLILEILSGQKNNTVRDGMNINLLSSAWRNWRQGMAANIIDPVLNAGSGISRDILRCIQIGLLCVQDNAAARPTMASIIQMLTSSSMVLPIPLEPAYIAPVGYESNSSIQQDYTSVRSTYSAIINDGDLYPR